jgi:hypothetical protein
VHTRALQQSARSGNAFSQERVAALEECLRQCCFAPPQLRVVGSSEKEYSELALTLILEVSHMCSQRYPLMLDVQTIVASI